MEHVDHRVVFHGSGLLRRSFGPAPGNVQPCDRCGWHPPATPTSKRLASMLKSEGSHDAICSLGYVATACYDMTRKDHSCPLHRELCW